MSLYDCFTFYNELTLLRLRLETLGPHVDRFVLVEATQTFSGKPKPLVFDANRSLFTPWLDRIEHIVVDDLPEGGDAWARETHQRNAIARGLTTARPHDIIMVSDVDEIPAPDALRSISHQKPTLFGMRMFYYFFNLELIHTRAYVAAAKASAFTANAWVGTKTTPFHLFKSAQALRMTKARTYPWYRIDRKNPIILESAGWHFSYLAQISGIMEKIANFSHQELNIAKINNAGNIEREIRRLIAGEELSFGAVGRYYGQPVRIDGSFPDALRLPDEACRAFILDL
jgi:beta-1,4-mannosyl-glycoprotein beta-1,4-N-acetylglucosaminyltransferase